ncbi:hypothetical protein DRJ22_04420 [Candidatus Woesearchaeota archaeon]|nr:MAG: hypothetical protein DRJ22_04420 [Candidatus Woesearchaeota archaeon]
MDLILFLSYIFAFAMIFYGLFNFQIKAIFIRNQKFVCSRCGECCRLLVSLDKQDIETIKDKGHKNFFYVKNKKKYLKRVKGHCMFLKFNNGKASCSIYDYRPKICRNFPKVKVFGVDAYDPRCNAFKLPKFLRWF